ncbi:uncharacterized protein LOC114256412 [Camellia sinensis]|uniref:uncharacterized protein LOC114256412 n=1 Tax=Camellia sinensis TaxID=4442 RepID=UPI00103587C3|nr:uncharacterized protein LOC114256412 [Camellia sinensis]
MEENNIVDDCGWKPKVGMPFDFEQAAYDFYNTYGGNVGFSSRKAYANRNKHTKEITSRTFVCYKERSRGIDKRDPLVKNPRQELHQTGPMSNKAPKTIFTDQHAAMANTNHRLCTWHLMQNAVKHVSSVFNDVGVKAVFSKFMHDIDDEEEFRMQWNQMLDKYDAFDNHCLE